MSVERYEENVYGYQHRKASERVAAELKELVRVVEKLNEFLAVCANNPKQSTFLGAKVESAKRELKAWTAFHSDYRARHQSYVQDRTLVIDVQERTRVIDAGDDNDCPF